MPYYVTDMEQGKQNIFKKISKKIVKRLLCYVLQYGLLES